MLKKRIQQIANQPLYISIAPIPRLGTFQSPEAALKVVTAKNSMGVYASSDRLFKYAIFGRDSLEVADDIMSIKPRLAENILTTIASLQGEINNTQSEEEPGKIIHEYRQAQIDGIKIDNTSQEILERLAKKWGGTSEELAYYGSVDATPLFIRTTLKYTELYGDYLLAKRLTLRSGQQVQFITTLNRAIDWLVEKLTKSKSGFLEYCRSNPDGIENQVWKDSKEFYIHKNGQTANHNLPIASVEVQALAYDALKMHASYFMSPELNFKAVKLRENVIKTLKLEKENYFALGVDYSESNKKRTIKTITANPASMLDSGIFDEMEEKERQHHIEGIVRVIMSGQFLTDAGIRSRSLNEGKLVSFWDYHGSYVSWPKETYDIAKGLRRQGFGKLAEQIENRLLNVIKLLRSYPEFIYVDGWGRVLGSAGSDHEHGDYTYVESSIQPEQIQAWTVSAVLAMTNARRPKPRIIFSKKNSKSKWRNPLELEILRGIPRVEHLKSTRELIARYPTYPYRIKKEGASQ